MDDPHRVPSFLDAIYIATGAGADDARAEEPAAGIGVRVLESGILRVGDTIRVLEGDLRR